MIPGTPHLYTDLEIIPQLTAPFQYPDNIVSIDELADFEMGGVALQDPSLGLQYQVWRAHWDPQDSTAYLYPDNDPDSAVAIFTESDVVEFSFTFDQNMRWNAVTRKEDDTAQFRWYDTVLEDYSILNYSGIQSIRLSHDDKRYRAVNFGESDIILTYMKTSTRRIYWRHQRDRYGVEYAPPESLTYPMNSRITHFGMNTRQRMQWRIGARRHGNRA